jgi:hypothetical protein
LSNPEDGDFSVQFDGALATYLNTESEFETEGARAALISGTVQPVIERTLRAKLHTSLDPADLSHANQDTLEILGEARLQLISELQKQKADPDARPIRDLAGYSASVTINAYRAYLRKKYPLRQKLRSKLRYLLTHHPGFELWEDAGGGWLCGIRKITGYGSGINRKAIIEAILAGSGIEKMRRTAGTIELVFAVFEFVDGPIGFEDLVAVVSEIQEIKDQTDLIRLDDPERVFSDPLASEDRVDLRVEAREFLRLLWTEITDMPERHRLALLLNLRDKQGDCVVSLLPLLRIASIKQIADVLGFKTEAFASVWNELPWDDNAIAAHMGITRQQVINLRQSARGRLLRKLGQTGGGRK